MTHPSAAEVDRDESRQEMLAGRRWGKALWLPIALALAMAPHPAWSQARGGIAGQIMDALTGRAVEDAAVSVVGTKAKTRTDREGFYRLADVAEGTVNLRVRHKYYVATVEQIPVGGGDVTLADFTLMPLSTVLGPLTVTARRDHPQPERGDTSNRSEAQPGVAKDTRDLLSGGVPGAVGQTGSGQVGAGVRIQIRGRHSFTLSSDPLVYLDGVRVSESIGAGLGGRGTTILDVVDPESIDHIEVLRGPEATLRYGLGAGNGVILIYTRKTRQ